MASPGSREQVDVGVTTGEILLDKYRVDAVLGSGGMGVVVRATHLGLGEPVAIKMLRPDASGQLQLSGWRPGKRFSYIVHMNDMSLDGVLFFAGTPQYLRIEAPLILHTPVDSYRLISGNSTNINYQVYSYPEPPRSEMETTLPQSVPIGLTSDQRSLYLGLPRLDTRIGTLAQSVTAADRRPKRQMRAAIPGSCWR